MKTRRKFNPIPKDIGDYFDYNPETGVITNKVHRGSRSREGKKVGSLKRGYLRFRFRNASYSTHRLAYFLHTGIDPEEKSIDHIDGNPSNNKFSNLRLATLRQNNANKKKRKTNTSGVTGVCWRKDVNKWKARIMVLNKSFDLGLFDDFGKAVAVRITAEHKFHQEYRHNHNDQYKLTPEMLEWGKKYLEDRIERLNYDIK